MLTEPVTCSTCGTVSVNGGTLHCHGCYTVATNQRRILEERVARLERFIIEESGIVNDWAAKKPCGTKMSDWIKGELDRWLKLNP